IHMPSRYSILFLQDQATPEIYTLSLHDALPISPAMTYGGEGDRASSTHLSVSTRGLVRRCLCVEGTIVLSRFTMSDKVSRILLRSEEHTSESSHVKISYAVFCLKKKKNNTNVTL